MQSCATDSILLIQVWAERQELSELLWRETCGAGGMHDDVNPTVHDGLIDWEASLHELDDWLRVALVDGLKDDLLCP